MIGMDVVVTNGDKTAAFNDLTGKQGTSSKYYAKVTMKPGVEKAAYGTVTVDGDKDAVWDNAGTIPITINLGSIFLQMRSYSGIKTIFMYMPRSKILSSIIPTVMGAGFLEMLSTKIMENQLL